MPILLSVFPSFFRAAIPKFILTAKNGKSTLIIFKFLKIHRGKQVPQRVQQAAAPGTDRFSPKAGSAA